MGSIPQSPTSLRPRSRDTGFPDNFCGVGNTSLPHPDARVGPDACITADDISVSKALSRHRRSFLAKHKRTISHGMITPEMERMHSIDLALLRETETLGSVDSAPRSSNSRASKDDSDSFTPTESSAREEPASPTSPTSTKSAHFLRRSPVNAHPERRRSLLRRWIHS
ncbi:hypothetical protein GQ53DRAFT_822028 [Thozetella sp. PMI_491]|nr:hypothetical protein GQ53DRAFT_822028 [Thozetella sp. PMI_491]